MDDERRPRHLDEDVDPDAISIWDLPLAPPAAARTMLPPTEIAAAAPPPDDDEITGISYSRALASTEDWFDDDESPDEPPPDATTRFQRVFAPGDEPPSAPPPPAPERPAGGGTRSKKPEDAEWTRFSRALGGPPPASPVEGPPHEAARALESTDDAVAPQMSAPPTPQLRARPPSEDTGAGGGTPSAAPPPVPEPLSAAAAAPPLSAAFPPRPLPTAAAPITRASRRSSRGLVLFGVLFGLVLVVLGGLLATVGAPPGGSRGGVLLLWLASVAVAGALVGGGVVAVVLLRRPAVPARRARPRLETHAAPAPPAAPPTTPAPSRPATESSQTRAMPVEDDAAPSRPAIAPRQPVPESVPAESPSPLPSDLDGVAHAPSPSPSPFERFVPPRSSDSTSGTEWSEGDTIVGRYRVARKITSGMGVVYLCHDAVQQQPVAIKTYRDLGEPGRTADGRQRDVLLARLFEAEALIWIRLGTHPNIVEAQYVVELHGKPHLFLELVGGPDGREQTLRQLVKAGRNEAPRVIRLGLQVCAGLEHATRVFPGLVHRDLKPENLLLAEDDTVKVTDFGLTRVFADVSGRVAALAGTPAYMSPEQCLGLASLDTRADIYALGVVLYELAAGRRPFTRDFLQAHLTETPPDPRQLAPDLPESLAAILLRCLAKRPEDRYQRFGELRAALAACHVELTGRPAELPAASNHPRTEREQAGIDLARAISLATLGRYDEAVELLNRAVLFDPGYAEAWRWRGIGLTALGQLTEAAECFDRAVALAPGDIDAWLEKGRLASRLGRREEAVRSFDAALAVNPKHVGARYERGAALFFLGRYTEASTDLAWANNQQPGPALQAAVDAANRRATIASAASDDSALDGLPVLISESPVSQSAPESRS